MSAAVAERLEGRITSLTSISPDFTVTPEGIVRPRIVVIGMGAITPLGLDLETTFQNMLQGKSGVSEYNDPLTKIKIAGLVKGFEPEIALKKVLSDNPKKDLARMSRAVQLSLGGAIQTMENARLLAENGKVRDDVFGVASDRFGIIVGTGMGGALRIAVAAETIKARGRGSADDLFQMLLERTASVVGMRLGLGGPTYAVTGACASGNLAIDAAATKIWNGDVDLMLAGGVESATNYISLELFRVAGALSGATDIYTASRPWDVGHSGFIFGEGSGFVLLCRLDLAKKLGRPILAEFFGYGETGDAYHDTAPRPDGDGQIRALKRAMQFVPEKNREGNGLGNSHATSTKLGDGTEAITYKASFTPTQLRRTVIVAPKGPLTHTVGASGVVEAVVGIKAMNEGVIFPNVNLKDRIPEAEGLNLPTKPVEQKTDVMYNNSFGFGGINATNAWGPYEERE